MKILKSTFLSIVLVSLTLFSCGPQVSTNKMANVDLSKYNTFAYLPNSNAEVPGKAYNDPDVNKMIIESINTNMEQAGYNLNRDMPDLLVLVSTKTNMKTETTTDPVYAAYPYSRGINNIYSSYNNYYYNGYAGYNNIVGYDTDTYNYKAGTLIVNLVDRNTKKTVWKGVAKDQIYDQTTDMAIQNMVNDIFKQYPLK